MIFPNNGFWLRLAGTVAMETALVVGLVFLIQLFIHAPVWRRALWQIGMVSLFVLLVSDLSGLGRGLAAVAWGQSPPDLNVSVQILPASNLPEGMAGVDPSKTAQSTSPLPVHNVRAWWPAILWGGGTALVLFRIAFAQGLFGVLRWRRPFARGADLEQRVTDIAKQLGIRQRIHVIQAPGLNTPIAFGLARPCIGLPSGFGNEFSREQQNAMLAHELAHLAARDPLWYLLADLVTASLWWQPLVWWARRRLHAASELAADEATALLEKGPESLAECLVRLGRQVVRRPRWAWMGVDGGFRSSLGQRVERLLAMGENSGPTVPHRPLFLVRISAVLGLTLGIMFLSCWLQGQEVPKQKDWQATLKQSWDGSAGAVIVMAALEPRNPQEPVAGATAPITNPDSSLPPRFYTKLFTLDPDFLDQLLKPFNPGGLNSTTNVCSSLRALFANAGLDFSGSQKAVFYNSARYQVYVRTSLQDLEVIEKLFCPREATDKTPGQQVENPESQTQRAKLLNRNHELDEDFKPIRLYSKSFHVEPPVFEEQLRNNLAGLNITNTVTAVRDLFEKAGVDFSVIGKSVSYKDGKVLVRSSLKDLEVIESLLSVLNQAPQQMVIESVLVEVNEATAREIGGTFAITNFTKIGTADVSGSFHTNGLTKTTVTHGSGILTESQSIELLKRLKAQNAMTISLPNVVTLAGRQAHIAIQESSSPKIAGAPLPGLIIDILPRMTVDDYMVKMVLIVNQTKRLENASGQLPSFSQNLIVAQCSVCEGQTVVLDGISSDDENGPAKHTLVFVTPTLIDRAGNRLHTSEEIPFTKPTGSFHGEPLSAGAEGKN